ncbi:MAG: LPS export ABC transporter periplasmic protein LptC [Candidatus Omnitrophota bacterium]|nr:LPS export ABC transporter periplasmic protein LptC [Candidatus Omnitrophota bacterium]
MRRGLIIALIAAFGLSIVSCSQGSQKKKEPEQGSLPLDSVSDSAGPEEAVKQEVSTFLLSGYSTAGAKEWEVKGDSAKIFTATNEIKLDNMTAKVWTEDNKCMALSSDIGTFDQATENARFKKNVVVTDESGTELRTDYLDWHPKGQGGNKLQLIKTDAYVEIEKENLKAEGVGLRAKHQLNNVQLNKEVEVSIKGKQKIVITCDGPLELDYKDSIAHFSENVKVDSERGELFADKMDVFIDKQKKSITKIVCTGNVKIKQEENITFSQKAVYFAEQGKVILLGKPRLVICPEQMGDGSMFNKNTKSN